MNAPARASESHDREPEPGRPGAERAFAALTGDPNEPRREIGDDAAELRRVVLEKLLYTVGKDKNAASDRDWFIATALAARDRIVQSWISTTRANYAQDRRRVYYL